MMSFSLVNQRVVKDDRKALTENTPREKPQGANINVRSRYGARSSVRAPVAERLVWVAPVDTSVYLKPTELADVDMLARRCRASISGA